MLFGLHVSIAGGVFNAPVNAAKTGCEVFQMFTRSPQGGPAPALTPEVLKLFKDNCAKFGYRDFYVHSPYYINLASANDKIANDSARVIRDDLERASLLGAKYLMTHLGSAADLGRSQAIKKVAQGIKQILTGYKGQTRFLIELSAGSGNIIGDTFEEINSLLKNLKPKSYKLTANIGVCFDTAHAFASGYDLRNAKAVRETLKKFDQLIGLPRLKLIHANDSKSDLGSHVDRHWHIGRGKIGLEGFKALVSYPALKNVNIILETPGHHGGPDDKRNLKAMKKLREAK